MSDPVLFEPLLTQDIFCEGIGRIQIVGQNARFFLYIQDGNERSVVAKIVIPLENLPEAIRMAVEATFGAASERVVCSMRRMISLN